MHQGIYNKPLQTATIFFSIFFLFFLVFALKCWACNNLLAFCDDPFDPSKLTEAEKFSLIDCTGGLCVKSVANIKGISCS